MPVLGASPRFGFVFFNDTATTEIYTLSLHDALPIFGFWRYAARSRRRRSDQVRQKGNKRLPCAVEPAAQAIPERDGVRSEEHTSELQSRQYLVCRLLLEKKKEAILGVHSLD